MNHERLALNAYGAVFWVLCELPDGAAAEALCAQLTAATGAHDFVPMAPIRVPGGYDRVDMPDGPLPVRAVAVDDTEDPIGEIVVWIEDGRLSALEFAWYSESAPQTWPRPSTLRRASGGFQHASR